jgi:hypothetical protein
MSVSVSHSLYLEWSEHQLTRGARELRENEPAISLLWQVKVQPMLSKDLGKDYHRRVRFARQEADKASWGVRLIYSYARSRYAVYPVYDSFW